MNLLFITSTRIGDAVLSTGILSHLIAGHPGLRITIVCGALPAPLFAAVPGCERLIVLHKRSFARHWLALWAACVGTKWDLIVDLRSTVIAWLLRARARHVVAKSRARIHRVRHLADLFGLAEPPPPRLWIAAEAAEEAARLIPSGRPVLAVGPTANWHAKEWRGERFAELVRRLTGPSGILPGASVAIFGAAAERHAAQTVIDAIAPERRIDLVGRIELTTAAACLARAAFYVGNDSGLMHLAAAAGVPTLGLFGPSPVEVYAPWGSHAAVAATAISYDALTAAPEYDHRETASLMDSLDLDAVEAAARALWRKCRDRAA